MARMTALPARRASGGSSLFRSTYLAMLGNRERQARHLMRGHLLALDDTALATLGYDREALERQGVPPLGF